MILERYVHKAKGGCGGKLLALLKEQSERQGWSTRFLHCRDRASSNSGWAHGV